MQHIRLEKPFPGERGKVKIAFSSQDSFKHTLSVLFDDADVDKVIQLLQDYRSGALTPIDTLPYPC